MTWFFEKFVVVPNSDVYQEFHPKFDHLFNSYYETVGKPFPRPSRGLLSRPTVKEVWNNRHYVEEHLLKLLKQGDSVLLAQICPIIEIGHNGESFSFDNEGPRHKVWLDPYRLASRPVTNGEFMEFIEDGGYEKVEYWLSDGIAGRFLCDTFFSYSVDVSKFFPARKALAVQWISVSGGPMMRTNQNTVQILDFQPTINDFRMDVLDGLKRKPKQLDSKLLYDEKGSSLFEKITTLPEYYPTRTELEILKRYTKDISTYIREHVVLIELGSGSSKKEKILLDAISDPVVYMTVDISKEFLQKSTESLVNEYPNLQVVAICTDFTQPFKLPNTDSKKVVFFPCSTFGNFEPLEAEGFLTRVSQFLTKDDGLLIGIGLRKSRVVLHQAYNDSAGITAAFNLNILERINRELNADFQLSRFVHSAFYNEEQERIEMHLKSLADQVVMIGKERIEFKKGETIHTENSYKFLICSFQKLAQRAGFKPMKVWTDSNSLFSVHYLQVE